MKQIVGSRFALAALAVLFFAAFAIVGCGKDDKGSQQPTQGGGGTSATPGGGGEGGDEAAGPAGAPGDATINGKVVLKGEAPKNQRADMSAHAECAKQHEGAVFDAKWAVGEGNAVQWVFVYVFKGDEVVGKKWPTPTEPAVIDQKGCLYEPRVFGVFKDQPIKITNSDPVMHNIHAQPVKSAEFNESQQPGAAPLTKSIGRAEVLVAIKCDVHNWMHAYAGVVTHPYFAVTDAKGAYSIGKLPAGKYTIRAVHESGQKVDKEIEVKAGETATLDFELEPK